MSDRIAEIEARLAEATPGPWDLYDDCYIVGPVPTGVTAGDCDKILGSTMFFDADTQVVLHAPTDIAFLLAALRTAESERADAIHNWDLVATMLADAESRVAHLTEALEELPGPETEIGEWLRANCQALGAALAVGEEEAEDT